MMSSHLWQDKKSTEELKKYVNLSQYWQNLFFKKRFEKGVDKQTMPVFITGATGFLGARFLLELLAYSSSPVYCLVRAKKQGACYTTVEISYPIFRTYCS